MKFGTTFEIDIAKLCCMVATSNEQSSLPNNSLYGGSSQFIYTVQGSATSVANGISATYTVGEITDTSSWRGHESHGSAGPDGVVWVSINPYDEGTVQYQLMNGPMNITHTGASEKTVFLGLKGSPTANGKTIGELAFCKIAEGKEVELNVPEGSVGLLLWK